MRIFKWNLKAEKRPARLTLEDVLEMSAESTENFRKCLEALEGRLTIAEHQVEATRKKVYRDSKDGEGIVPDAIPGVEVLQQTAIVTGTPVP